MDGGGRTCPQDNQNPSSRQGGAGADLPKPQGGSGSQLKSRSPFISSLRESDLSPRQANPIGPQSQTMSANHSHHPYYSPATPFQGHLPPNGSVRDEEPSLSSRGVLSLQSGGHSSGHSSFSNSGFSSYDDASSMNPLVNQSLVQPQGVIGGYPADYGRIGTGGGRYSASGGHLAQSNIGSRIQGQGHVYPHPSSYQPMQYSGVPQPGYSSGNARHNEREFPHHYQYNSPYSQHQPVYGAHYSTSYGATQAPLQPHHYVQSGTEGVSTSYYPHNTPIAAHHQYGFGRQEPAPSHAYQQPPHHPSSSFYSSSFGSTGPSTTHHRYQQQTPSTVPYAPLPPHSTTGVGPYLPDSSSTQTYNGPQGGYAPSSIPYQPLQSSSSVSSLNSLPSNRYPAVSQGLGRTQSPPQPQWQPAQSGQPSVHPQPQYQQSTHAQFSSNFASTFQTSTQSNHPVDGSANDQPQGADVVGSSAAYTDPGTSGEGEDGRSGEMSLTQQLEKLKLQHHQISSSGFVSKQLPTPDSHSSQLSSSSLNNDNDESTCVSFLSGGLGSRQEEQEDKTGSLPKRSIEILEQPRDYTVSLNGTIALKCKARIIDSKLEEEPDYLWYKDGEPLVGEISGECVLERAGEGEGGQYFCLVSHPDGQSAMKSQTAIVTIRTRRDSRAPVLTHQPEAYVEVVREEPLILTIEAKGEGLLTYKWFKGAQELEYCCGDVLKVTAVRPLDAGQYCCTVSNDYGSVLSDVVLVKVVAWKAVPPPITRSSPSRKRYSSNPDDEVPSDKTLRWLARPVARHTKNWARLALYLGLLPTEAAGTHYQASEEQKAYHLLWEWRERKKGTLYALKTILSQAGITLHEPSLTSPPPSTTSSLSSSSTLPSLSISSQPQDVIVVYGQEARLEVRAETLNHSCTYQWYKDGRKLFGKTQKSMLIASTVDSDEGSYSCQISNSEGLVMSHPATITVVSVAPQSLQQPTPHSRPVGKRSHPKHLPIHEYNGSSGGGVYGLKGRGFADENHDDDCEPQPLRTADPSPVPPPKAVTGVIRITEHPQPQVAPLGSSVTLTCRASLSGGGSPDDLTYVWYMNGLSLLEHTTPEYRIASLTEEDEGMYSCEISTVNHSVMSQMASVSVTK